MRRTTIIWLLMLSCLAVPPARSATVAGRLDRDCLAKSLDADKIRQLQSNSSDQRAAAARLLGDIDHPNQCTVKTAISLLEDPADLVRSAAAAALVRYRGRAIGPLLDALAGPDRQVEPSKRTGKDGQTTPLKSDYIAWVLIKADGAETDRIA